MVSVGTFILRLYYSYSRSIQTRSSRTHTQINKKKKLSSSAIRLSCRSSVQVFLASRRCQNDCCPYLHAVGGADVEKIAVKILRQTKTRRQVTFWTYVEAGIDTMNRTKSVTATLVGIFREHQSTSMNSATFSKSPSRQTSPLHALQALCVYQLYSTKWGLLVPLSSSRQAVSCGTF